MNPPPISIRCGWRKLLATLDRLSRTRDLTLVFLGEDLRLARFCSRIMLLARGKILADGPAEVILREVERLRGLGLNPPELPALFHDLGQATLPSHWRQRWTRPETWDGIDRLKRIPPCHLP